MSTNLTFSDASDPSAVVFRAKDGRERTYSFAGLPCAELHEDLRTAFATALRQVNAVPSAEVYFVALRRLLTFLGSLGEPLEKLSALQTRHLDQYRASRAVTVSAQAWNRELSVLLRLLRSAPYGALSAELGNDVARYGFGPRRPGGSAAYQVAPLYSAHVLEPLLAAARADVSAVLERAETAGTGEFRLLASDLAPLLVLGIWLSRLRAGELRELPAAHRVVDGGRAVQVVAFVRRSPGAYQMRWEVRGEAKAALHAPGDFYLAVHHLAEAARREAGSDRLWCAWTRRGPGQPSQASLGPLVHRWAAGHRLTDEAGLPLAVSLHRLGSTARRMSDH